MSASKRIASFLELGIVTVFLCVACSPASFQTPSPSERTLANTTEKSPPSVPSNPKPEGSAPSLPIASPQTNLKACATYDTNVCGNMVPGPSQTRYPVILAHGFGGFNEFGPLDYFYKVPDYLRQLGYSVHNSLVDPFNGTPARAKQLAQFIDHLLACTCAGKVNLVAHSQGGLDARYVVSTLGYGDRVASITTIATPHGGTVVADIALRLIPGLTDDLLNTLAWFGGNIYTDPTNWPDYRAALTLFSTSGIKAFNQANPDDERVKYYSWAGLAGLTANGKSDCSGAENPLPYFRTAMTAVLLPTWAALGGLEGVANDGLVTVQNAKWGRFMGCVPADHLQEVGHLLGATGKFDYRFFFKKIVTTLRYEDL